MKFVFFGYDFMISAVRRLLEQGHELHGIMTFECDNIFNFNQRTIALAEELSVPYSLEPPTPEVLEGFLKQGTEVFLSAGYPFKIPPIPEDSAYAINFHPALLPKGRGLMPTPYIIMSHPEAAGVTLHKITEKLDAGDILYQEPLPLHERESVETLSVRIAMRSEDILPHVMKDLPRYWQQAKPQDESQVLYFPPPDEELRMLDFTGPVTEIDKKARAFGRYGSMAHIQGRKFAVFQCEAWEEEHGYPPGSVACLTNREIVIACADGFACLKEFQELPPE